MVLENDFIFSKQKINSYFDSFFINDNKKRIEFYFSDLTGYYNNNNYYDNNNSSDKVKNVYITIIPEFDIKKTVSVNYSGDLLSIIYFIIDIECSLKAKAVKNKDYKKSLEIFKSDLYIKMNVF